MKKIFKPSLLLLGVVALLFACKKDEIDTTALTDYPPGIFSITPAAGSVVGSGQNFDVVVKFVSGSVSTLSTTTVQLTDAGGAEITTKTEALSGTADSIVIEGATFNASGLPVGTYKLNTSVTDTKGKTLTRTTEFEIGIKPNIGIIGSATPDGWNSDVDMPEVSPGVYELVIALVAGEAKFRADNAWTANWGANTFPSGIGTQDGPNIPVAAGTWKVRFEFPSGAYSFTPAVTYASVAKDLYLLGSFNNFEGEEFHFSLAGDNTWVLNEMLLKPGDLFKFSEGPNFMGSNWGDSDGDGRAELFGNNITFNAPEGEAYYKITFNDKTRIYTIEFVRYPSIGIIGSATPTGWDSDTDLEFKGNGIFYIKMTLTDGAVKFRANNSWDTNWGGATFPTGTAVPGGPDIMVTAGTYEITFDRANLTYKFETAAGFQDVGIIGNATPGGWNDDTDMWSNGDGTFNLVIGLDNGFVKFRANNSWDVNWGSADFPAGTGTQGGSDIPVTKGIYLISFNSITGEYSFAPASIGLIGSATPGGWNDDTNMTEDAAIGVVTLNIALTDGAAKFRVNDDWKYNWGAADFPSGTGTAGGSDIPVPAGTYTVTFNVNTKAYSFQ
ncbi:MAG TPA: SusF/SusE family outer membrane protein [Saprospiraceae bacterium]|nr:SusF/SusE family outer membrane protein [Saprospiraceae bacterium]